MNTRVASSLVLIAHETKLTSITATWLIKLALLNLQCISIKTVLKARWLMEGISHADANRCSSSREHICGASPAMCDHTVLPATRYRRTRATLSPARQAGTRFAYPGGMEG